MEASPPVKWLLKRVGKWNQITAIDEGPKGYTRYGFRVPAVFISPYARPGHLSSMTYDHTSILKLIERKWNLPPLTDRDRAAADPLDDMLDLSASPAPFATAPPLHPPAKTWAEVLADPDRCRPTCPKRKPRRYPSVR
jgi:phospholipase C